MFDRRREPRWMNYFDSRDVCGEEMIIVGRGTVSVFSRKQKPGEVMSNLKDIRSAENSSCLHPKTENERS